MSQMFDWASAFNQPLSFHTSSVTDMSNMFAVASALSDANKLLMYGAWAGSTAFDYAYGSSWDSASPPPSPPLPSPSPPPPPPPSTTSTTTGGDGGSQSGASSTPNALTGA